MTRSDHRYWRHAAALILLFLAVRLGAVGWAGAAFENIEDYRVAAGAEMLLIYGARIAAGTAPAVDPLLVYPPDHYSLSAPLAAALLAPIRWALGPLTPFQFKLLPIAIGLAGGLLWLRLLMRLHPGRGAAWFVLLYSFLPPTFLELSLLSPDSHGITPPVLAIFFLLLHRVLRPDRPPGAVEVWGLGLWCGVAGLLLPSLFLLPVIAALALAGRRRWWPLLVVVVGAIPALLTVASLAARFLPTTWIGRDHLAINPAGFSKLLMFAARELPAAAGSPLWLGLAAAAVGLALFRLAGRAGAQRPPVLGWILLYPLGWLAVYGFTTIAFDPGLRPSHTYKYFAPLLPCFYLIICFLPRPGRLLATTVLAGLLVMSVGLTVREYYTPARFPADPARVWQLGYQQYGELLVQLADTPDALRVLPLIDEPGRRAAFLVATGELTAVRAGRESRSYRLSLTPDDARWFLAGAEIGADRNPAARARVNVESTP